MTTFTRSEAMMNPRKNAVLVLGATLVVLHVLGANLIGVFDEKGSPTKPATTAKAGSSASSAKNQPLPPTPAAVKPSLLAQFGRWASDGILDALLNSGSIPEEKPWKSPYGAGDSTVRFRTALPITALRDKLMNDLIKDNPKKTLPAVIKQESAPPMVMDMNITSTRTKEISEKLPTPGVFKGAEFRVEMRRDKIKVKVKVPRAGIPPWEDKEIETDGPPYPVRVQLPGTGIWLEPPGFKEVKKFVDEKFNELAKIEIVFSYAITLNSIDISMKGNKLKCVADFGFTLEGKVTKTGIIPAGPTAITNGKMRLILERNLAWDEDGKLVLQGGSSHAAIDPITSLTSFPNVDPNVILKVNVLLETLSRVLPQAVNHEVNKQVASNLPSMTELLEKLKQPRDVEGDGKYYLHPRALELYPLTSDGKSIAIGLAVRCRPEVVFGNLPPNGEDPPKIPVVRPDGSAPQPGCHLEAECRFAATYLGNLIQKSLGDSGPVRFDRARVEPAGDGKARITAELNKDDFRVFLVKEATARFGSLGKECAERAKIPTTGALAGTIERTGKGVVLKEIVAKPALLLSCLPEGTTTIPPTASKNTAKDGPQEKLRRLEFQIPTEFAEKALEVKGDWGRLTIRLKPPEIRDVFLTSQEFKAVVVTDGSTEVEIKQFTKK